MSNANFYWRSWDTNRYEIGTSVLAQAKFYSDDNSHVLAFRENGKTYYVPLSDAEPYKDQGFCMRVGGKTMYFGPFAPRGLQTSSISIPVFYTNPASGVYVYGTNGYITLSKALYGTTKIEMIPGPTITIDQGVLKGNGNSKQYTSSQGKTGKIKVTLGNGKILEKEYTISTTAQTIKFTITFSDKIYSA